MIRTFSGITSLKIYYFAETGTSESPALPDPKVPA